MVLAPASCRAPHSRNRRTEKVLHFFSGTGKGFEPSGNLAFDSAGRLYGTTILGGAHDYGVVFQLTPSDSGEWSERWLSFTGGNGLQPEGGVIFDSAGSLYGTAELGGSHHDGVEFRITP